MSVKKINIDDSKLYNEFKEKITELIDLMKHFNPYELLSSAVNYYKQMQIISKNIKEYYYDNATLKFSFEFLQMIYSLIREEDLILTSENNEAEFHKILKLSKEINGLMYQYVFFKIMEDNTIPEEYKEYIISDFSRLIVTGKRYDIFENEHHKDVLEPFNDCFYNTYAFELNSIYEGIEKLKHNFVFGLNESNEKIQNIIDSNEEAYDENENRFFDEQIAAGYDVIYNIIGLELHNVQKICNWSIEFINLFSLSLGDNFRILEDITIDKVIDLYSQINSKPFIKIKNDYYCLNPHRLFDNIDRIIIKDLYKKNYVNIQDLIKLNSDNCETLTAKMFKEILPNARIDLKNYYKIPTGFAENDLLIEYDKNLLIIEIKSGSFTPDVAINNINSHLKTLSSLIGKADEQTNNFYEILQKKKRVELFEENRDNAKIKRVVLFDDYHNIYKIVVTLEAFNEIESRIEKFKIFTVNKDSLVICLDDLRVYKDYFKNNPLVFFHYLNQRVKATRNNKVLFNDELDHLGLYIDFNDYVLYLNRQIKGYKNVENIYFEEPRMKLDKYYNDKYFRGVEGIKPSQDLPDALLDIIHFCNLNFVDYSTIFINNVLSLCREDKYDIFYKQIEEIYKINIFQNRYKLFMFIGIDGLFAITCLKYNDNISLNSFDKRIYANMLLEKIDSGYGVFLYYNFKKEIQNIIIRYYDISKIDSREEIEEFSSVVRSTRTILPKKKIKIGRNELCPCGSGKKYKYCCLNKK